MTRHDRWLADEETVLHEKRLVHDQLDLSDIATGPKTDWLVEFKNRELPTVWLSRVTFGVARNTVQDDTRASGKRLSRCARCEEHCGRYYKIAHWGLTPELSRPARGSKWSLEATKRVRLE